MLPIDCSHRPTGHDSRRERIELADLERALSDLPREVLITGGPDDADLLLSRTLRALRAERAGRPREVGR